MNCSDFYLLGCMTRLNCCTQKVRKLKSLVTIDILQAAFISVLILSFLCKTEYHLSQMKYYYIHFLLIFFHFWSWFLKKIFFRSANFFIACFQDDFDDSRHKCKDTNHPLESCSILTYQTFEKLLTLQYFIWFSINRSWLANIS